MAHEIRTAVAYVAIFVAFFAPVVVAQGPLRPLPLVTRKVPASEETLFRKPDVILIARIVQSCDTEQVDDVIGGHRRPLAILRSYVGTESYPVLVNKRAADDPDLSSTMFYVRPRSDSPSLTVGKTYLLMLDAVKDPPSGPPYRVSHRQVGFEVMNEAGGDRVRPIVRGGELDAYDGRLLDDLIKEIQGKK